MRSQRAKGIRDKPIAPSSPWQTDVIDKRFLGCRPLCICEGQGGHATEKARSEIAALDCGQDVHRVPPNF
jgi:hypothetical protein